MKRLALAAALTLIALGALAVACGHYTPPHRIPPPATPTVTAPLTDPGAVR